MPYTIIEKSKILNKIIKLLNYNIEYYVLDDPLWLIDNNSTHNVLWENYIEHIEYNPKMNIRFYNPGYIIDLNKIIYCK